MSASTNGVDSAWRRRQTIKRGVTRKVKLTSGNFITEYPVPTPVFTAVEAKWTQTQTTEFTYVFHRSRRRCWPHQDSHAYLRVLQAHAIYRCDGRS
jgi:hypothetical protein